MNHKKLLSFSVLSGLLLSLPWMLNSFPWTLFFALIPLLVVEDLLFKNKQHQNSVLLFFYAWLTFILWNGLSTWWIGYVSLLGMALIALINSFLMAIVWWLMQEVRRRWPTPTGYFSLIIFWLSFEYLHFHWAVQWPWMNLGNGLSNAISIIQWYELTGVLGGTLWVLLVNILLFSMYKRLRQKDLQTFFQLTVFTILLIGLPVLYSVYRYSNYKESGKSIEVVVVQPNVDPYSEKFSETNTGKQARKLIDLSASVVTDSTNYILAPETALPNLWEEKSIKQNVALKGIDSLIMQFPNLRFVVGAITQKRLEPVDPVSYTTRRTAKGENFDIFNSALLIDHSPQVQIGHKQVLVSGVEKMPFQKYFAFMGKYALQVGGISGSLTAGSQPCVFKEADGEKIGSVICFESVFGQQVASVVRKGANLIFVMTNDGWWKESAGLEQHFGFSKLRAIETRRSIVRSANTGISGFINQRGDVIAKTKANTEAALSLQIHLNQFLTFYALHGDYLGLISLLLSGMMGIYFLIDHLKVFR